MIKTEWFPGDIKPAHNGLYERREDCLCCVTVVRWTGTRFYRANFDGEVIGFIGDEDQKRITWRGLKRAA